VEYVAELVKVPAADFAGYSLNGRTAEYHRAQIREALGFRPSTRADEDRLIGWLVEDRLREALLVQCRVDRIEPPGRIDRIFASAQARAERAFCARTIQRLGEVCVSRLLALVGRAIVSTGEHGESEAALRHVRRHFITVDNLRAVHDRAGPVDRTR